MILVTGGAGFVGSNLLYGLEQRDVHDVVVCDALGKGDKWQNISKREVDNVIRPDQLHDFLADKGHEIDVIVNCAGTVSTAERDADMVMYNNFALSRFLANWAAENDVRYIYLSSYSTYGDGSGGAFFGDRADCKLYQCRVVGDSDGWGLGGDLSERRPAASAAT